MTTTPSDAGAAAVAACAVCGAGPLLALLGGVGAASAIGAVWVPALAVLAVAAVTGLFDDDGQPPAGQRRPAPTSACPPPVLCTRTARRGAEAAQDRSRGRPAASEEQI
ncbi:hypothetical protein [Streptomyces sp. NPDC002676]